MTKNELLNQPIQGTAAHIVQDAMCRLSEEAYILDDEELEPIWNVHDDLGAMVHDEHLREKIEAMARIMCKPTFKFINVPLIVEASVGARWHKMEEIGVYRSDKLFNIPNPYEKEAA